MRNVDTSKFDSMVDIVEGIGHHRGQQNGGSSDALYYQLMARHYRRVQQASKEGKPLVACSSVPSEIFYAMDIVPMPTENITNGTVATLKIQDELLSLAQELGWSSSICSSHRIQAVMLARGWLPRPQAVVWGHQVCDPSAKAGEIMHSYYDIPGFCVDRPYGEGDRDIKYYAQELADLVRFLEEVTHCHMDWQRLGRALDLAYQMARLFQEIIQLRGATPCPMSNRQGMQVVNISYLYSGTEEGLHYFQTVRGELKAQVEQGIGYARHERRRLVGLFPPPTYCLKLLDWMEREHGAMVVAEPLSGHWGDWEIDPAEPLESLARKCFAIPNTRQLHGPAYHRAIPDVVTDALAFETDGAIFWANTSCAQCCGIARIMVDALREKAGLPTLVLYADMLDPSGVSLEELKGQIEDFLEALARKTASPEGAR